MTMKARAVLIRLDRIGDLILTLPVERFFKDSNIETHWIVSHGLGFIANSCDGIRFTEFPAGGGWTQVWRLQRLLRKLSPEIVVVFHAKAWVAFAVWLSGVKWRFGPLSQWFSFLFYNRGVRQKRSESKRHELEYNEELALKALQQVTGSRRSNLVRTHQSLPAKLLSRAPLPIHFKESLKDREYVVVHPGMAGSARNCSADFYVRLIGELKGQFEVVVTGTSTDRVYVEPLKAEFQGIEGVHWFEERLSGEELLSVLSGSRGVVAPSTGVVHIAASLGVPTIGLYSPVRVQAATRWGPRGSLARSITPAVNCPGQFRCLMENCNQFDCMGLIKVSEVIDKLKETQILFK